MSEEIKEEVNKEVNKDTENQDTNKETKEKEKLSKEEIYKLKYKQDVEKEKAIVKVIKGVNDVWEKEYNFEEADLNFKVKIKIPNAMEQSQIRALTDEFLFGKSDSTPDFLYNAYFMLATLQIVGQEVPIEFRDPEEIYNMDYLAYIHRDWRKFLRTFRY
ncbi:tail assembly chaperone [Staphylococcus phage PG-2021_15]